MENGTAYVLRGSVTRALGELVHDGHPPEGLE